MLCEYCLGVGGCWWALMLAGGGGCWRVLAGVGGCWRPKRKKREVKTHTLWVGDGLRMCR